MADIEPIQFEAPIMPQTAILEIAAKVNELVEAYNQHVHYAREMQYPTSTPDNPKVYITGREA